LVENDMDVLPVIRMRYDLKKYNVRSKKYLSVIQDWYKWSGGEVPSMELNANGEVRHYVGVDDFRKLAEKCKEWLEASNGRRPSIEPVHSPIDASEKPKSNFMVEENIPDMGECVV
jgi:hypothetical protein